MQQVEENDLRQRRSKKLVIKYEAENFSPSIRNDSTGLLPHAFGYVVIIIFVITLKFLYVFDNTLPSPIQIADAGEHPDRFIGERAELLNKRLTSLGPRVVGSYENEILAVDFLKRELSFIVQESNKMYNIEIDIQKPTGSYYLMFKPFGFKNYYANVQNVVVKLSSGDSKNSILMNCHYDTVPESPGASDNGVNCAIMLEILRVLATGTTPLKNNVIFLFNGAEENPLQASHGFSSKHKWRKEVKVVINLDSAGAGGRELLFQTTGEPWLVKTYAKAVPRPTAGVQGEELFQFGIIPSDTDFRIFRDFGGYPGFDIAHCTNGYIYHTKFDSVEFVPPGVYQNTGDNMLALVRELISSSEVGIIRPKSQVVYFDVFTLFMIVYTVEFGIILNLFAVFLSCCAIYKSVRNLTGSQPDWKRFSVATGGQLLGLLLAGASVFIVSKTLDFYNCTMSWYVRPWLIIPLYSFPIAISQAAGMAVSGAYLKKDSLKHKVILFINGGQLLWTFVVLVATLKGLRSSFMIMFFILFPSVGSLFVTFIKKTCTVKTYLITHISCLLFPLLYVLTYALRTFAVIVPITARMGPQMNPEMVIGALVFITSAIWLSLIVPCLMLIRKFKSFLFSILIVHLITMLIVIKTDFGFPYDGNIRNLALQRFLTLHCERTFHDAKGLVRKSDSGIFVLSLDRNNINYVSMFLPELRSARTAADDCPTELFCGFPIFTPRSIKPAPYSYWIPAAPPTIHHPTSLEIVNQTQILVNVRRMKILITGPDHITVGLSPRSGVELVKWSFDPLPPVELHSWNGRKTYMVYYSHGLIQGPLEFHVDLKISQNHSDHMMDVAVVGHYMHDKKFRTTEFKKFLSRFPSWTHLTPWTATYKSWVI